MKTVSKRKQYPTKRAFERAYLQLILAYLIR